MNQLTAMKVFKRVVELNGFSAAARELKLSNAAVSKNVSDLEAHLDTQLLVRTTRRMSVTEAGDAYYRKCVRILQDLEDADINAGLHTSKPRGRLRVNAPMSFGLLHLAPLVSEFLRAYEEIEVELVLNDHVVDLIQGDFDVGLRVGGALKDSSLVCKKLSTINRVLCGAPQYFAEFGHPLKPTDLSQHRCLIYSLSSSFGIWSFTQGFETESVEVSGPLTVNNSLALREALTAAVGISLVPKFIVNKELKTGALVQSMPSYEPSVQSLYALYPQSKHVPEKVRVFVDFLAKRFSSESSDF